MNKVNLLRLQPISQQIQELIKFYSSLGERFDLFYTVEKGTFVTGSIKHIYTALDQLKNNFKLISELDTFFDAGSGDGRICALASLMGLQSYGIEYHEMIANASIENINQLQTKGIIKDQKTKPIIVKGDFLEEISYSRLGIKFEEISIFYNFVTYHENLAEKIINQSPKGTKFILHSPCPISFSPKGMKLVRELPLSGIYHVLYVFQKI